MKFIKLGIRFWFTVGSMFSFVAGWVMLAHAPKPWQAPSSQSQDTVSVPTLEPLPPLSSFDKATQNQAFSFQSQSQPIFRPRLRTGGS